MGTHSHKSTAPVKLTLGIITLSTTRTLAEDQSGLWIKETALNQGHQVVYHQLIPDDAAAIKRTVLDVINGPAPQVLLLTGGTGISAGDVTIEAVRPLLDKELTAFGALFAQLSYGEIGSPALLSRATAGIAKGTVVFCMPGSLKACKLACRMLIFPEMGHLVKHVREG